MVAKVRVLIADDQPRSRSSIRALLATWPYAGEVLEAADGQEAVDMVARMQPDVVLMDVRMPRMDGIEATRLIKLQWPLVKVVVWSMFGDHAADARGAGADAFVGKGAPPSELLASLARVIGRCPGGRNGHTTG